MVQHLLRQDMFRALLLYIGMIPLNLLLLN